ncbi:uncharacterized protein LOC128220094 [Mya arenaria]|uniref:uncharacterized protein LOC128220094 n=1 Tax=Mya arenaria TaxID=6604 RepID=UPI0022E375E4|nr:uncharacterized protein LOC128220094 [Mya arenaria]
MPCFLCVSGSKDVRILPECNHAFCEDCLTEYITATFETTKNKGKKKKKYIFKCPQCSQQFQGPDAKSLISEWIRQLRILPCKPSEENKTETVLTESVTEHHDITSTCDLINATLEPQKYTFEYEDQVSGKTSHRKEVIDSTEMSYKFCSVHRERNVEFYCCSHDEFICRMCIIRKRNHRHCENIVDLEDAGKIIRKDGIHLTVLSDLEDVKEYNEHLINEIEESRKTSESQRLEIGKTFEIVRQKALHFIDKHEKACLKTFDEVMDNQSAQLNNSKAELKSNLKETEDITIQLKDIIESDEKSSYLFPTVLKIIRDIYEKKANIRDNYLPSTVTKLKIQESETELLEKSCKGVHIAYENRKVTLSSFPFLRASPVSLLRAVSEDSDIQTSVLENLDQNKIVIKQSSELQQAESVLCKRDAGKEKLTDKEDTVSPLNIFLQNLFQKDADKTLTIEKENEKKFAYIAKKHEQDIQKHVGIGSLLEVRNPTRSLTQAKKHQKNIILPDLRRTSSTNLVLPYTQQCWVADCLVLKKGKLIISDALHNRVVVTNDDFSFVSDMIMNCPPGHMAVKENGSILVCQNGTNRISCFDMDTDAELKLQLNITLPWHPKSINSLPNGDVLVSMQAQDYAWKIIKLQRHDDDTFKRFNTVTQSLDDGYSLHVAVGHTGSPLVIQCCESKGVVKGFDLDGNQTFSYECDKPEAATHDKYGFIYVVEFSGVVHVLRQDGTPLGVNHISNMHKCKRIVYDERNDRLIVTSYKGSTLHVLHIGYSSI